jgi:soluble lytic murein transglycosylase-like protein
VVVRGEDGVPILTDRPDPGRASLGSRGSSGSAALPKREAPRAVPFDALIRQEAARAGIEPALLRAVVRHESAFDPRAVSHKGAMGLAQLMPATARRFGAVDPFDPAQNLRAGARYLAFLLDRYEGDTARAVAGYHAGEGTVDRYGGVPPYPETLRYVGRVLGELEGSVRAPAPGAGRGISVRRERGVLVVSN